MPSGDEKKSRHPTSSTLPNTLDSRGMRNWPSACDSPVTNPVITLKKPIGTSKRVTLTARSYRESVKLGANRWTNWGANARTITDMAKKAIPHTKVTWFTSSRARAGSFLRWEMYHGTMSVLRPVDTIPSRTLGTIMPIRKASVMPVAPQSVSYTHLRAHETRHDLVCRL